jgi:hypothetical protein
MLTISKPLSAGQGRSYQKEFTAKEQNYWPQRAAECLQTVAGFAKKKLFL